MSEWFLPVALSAWFVASATQATEFDGGMLPLDHLAVPNGPARGVAVLYSDLSGWGDPQDQLASELQDEGIAVIGIDLPAYLKVIEASTDECVYLIADIERMAHQIGRATGATSYPAPILVGENEAGGLALTLMVQTPEATVGGTVVTNPTVAIPLKKPLCTRSRRTGVAGGAVYDLLSVPVVEPVSIVLDAGIDEAIRARMIAFQARDPDNITVSAGFDVSQLRDRIIGMVDRITGRVDSLPTIELPVKPSHDTMAIVISGDGGWRDLDMTVAEALQASGVPSVGLDALRYFWRARTPAETARDVAAIIDKYTKAWGVSHVALVGYSFGAGILPETYLALDPATRAKVIVISLLGLAPEADWEITVQGWLGSTSGAARAVGPALEKVPPDLMQCFHGENEADSVCPALAARGVEVIRTKGGHHFDGDYDGLAADILAGIDRHR